MLPIVQDTADTPSDRLRLTVPEAAKALGISPEAVRNRLSRGTLQSVKEDGTVYVLIDHDRARYTADRPSDRSGESVPLISEMRERISLLERELEEAHAANRENRRIIAALTQRIPELEPPSEPLESPVTATEGTVEPTPSAPSEGPQQGTQRRPWFWWWAA